MTGTGWPPTAGATDARRWSTLTASAVLLSGLGALFAFASGIGLPLALAGAICGGLALRRDPAARPWPLVAMLVGIVGALIGAVLVVIATAVWAPLVPGLLLG
jgi:hypothetical protein